MALLIAAGWFLIKPLLKIRNKKEEADIQLGKWKRNPEIFKLLLTDQKAINTNIVDNLFYFGKESAPLHIMMVTNPYCKPCAKAHEILAEIFKKNSDDISFSILFTPGNGLDNADKKYVAVENILNAANKDNALEILHEWFHTMNLDEWQATYHPKPLKDDNENLIKRFAEWTVLNRPAFTPAIYLNGYLLPKLYNLEDIPTFLFDISSGLLTPNSVSGLPAAMPPRLYINKWQQ
jgi:thiol-disulfide isomerase/thioredoxin